MATACRDRLDAAPRPAAPVERNPVQILTSLHRDPARPAGRVLANGVAVECWIGVVDEARARVVHVAGRLAGVHVPDLLAACAETSRPVHVDLSEVVSVDAVGVRALCRIRDAGHELVGTPKYIALKLESSQPGPGRIL